MIFLLIINVLKLQGSHYAKDKPDISEVAFDLIPQLMVGNDDPPSIQILAYSVGHAVGFTFNHSNLNSFRHAFKVFVKLAACGLARAYACCLLCLLDVVPPPLHEGIAAGLKRVADGNGAGLTIAVGVVSTFADHALCDNGHFNANHSHRIAPY
jgi:hypothetical protein